MSVRIVGFLLLALTATIPSQAQDPSPPIPGEVPDSAHPWRQWESEARIAAAARRATDQRFEPHPEQLLFDVTHYDLDLDLDPVLEQLTGSVTMSATVTGDTLEVAVLDLSWNLMVDAVRVDGEVTAFTHEFERISVALDPVRTAGEALVVTVDYHGDPTAVGNSFGWDFASGHQLIWTLSEPYGARTWWPCKDLNSDKADSVDLHVTVPSDLVVASNGLLVGEESAGENTTYHWHEGYPICTYLVSVAAHPYAQFTDTYTALDGQSVPIVNYVVPEYESAARDAYGLTPAMMTVFAEGFGEYPFLEEKYGHAHFPWGGGMEHQTCSSMIYWYYHQNLTAHELAHQWWGDLVTCADFHHIWLNEGFATWAEAYWLEQSVGFAAYKEEMAASAYYGYGTIYVEDPFNFQSIFDVNLTYNKASWVVHMLRGVLGDDDFFAGLALYRQRFAYGVATTEDLQSVMEDVSGRDLGPFFTQWIYREGYPMYEFSSALTPQEDGTRIQVWIRQTQYFQTVFAMPIQLRLVHPLGREDVVVENEQRLQYYDLIGPPDVTEIEFDPDEWILRTIEVVEPTAAPEAPVEFSLRASPNPFNPATTFRFDLPGTDHVQLRLFDVQGRLVQTLVDGQHAAGAHAVRWDGRDRYGSPVPSGTYHARLNVGGRVDRNSLLLVR